MFHLFILCRPMKKLKTISSKLDAFAKDLEKIEKDRLESHGENDDVW